MSPHEHGVTAGTRTRRRRVSWAGAAARSEWRGCDKSKSVLAAATAAAAAVVAAPAGAAGPPTPLDPQNWSFQDNLTWADYKPFPGPNYSDPSIQPTVRKWRVALILVDYPDRPFTVTQPAGRTSSATRRSRGAQHPARAGAAVLRRLPQQAVRR